MQGGWQSISQLGDPTLFTTLTMNRHVHEVARFLQMVDHTNVDPLIFSSVTVVSYTNATVEELLRLPLFLGQVSIASVICGTSLLCLDGLQVISKDRSASLFLLNLGALKYASVPLSAALANPRSCPIRATWE